MDVDRTTFGPSTAMACFSEQGRTTFKHGPGRLSIILSPPETFLEMEPEQILATACANAERLGLYITDHVTDYRVISHPADFYSLAPGSEELRPTQQTPVVGRTLAGDYTQQRFPATMEGAVVSGQQAAEAVMQE
jgi:15-cis-phytoene desaturase